MWLYALGALFVLVTLFLPRGIVGLIQAKDKDQMTIRDKVLYLEKVTVSFDGFKALNELSLYVDPGELLCIIGPNGAGKTTMMDVITGKTRPDSGTAWFGREIDLLKLSEPEIAQIGIGRKFQKPTVFEQLTVFENLELALAGTPFVHEDVSCAECRRRSTRESMRFSKSSDSEINGRRSERYFPMAKSNGSKSECC